MANDAFFLYLLYNYTTHTTCGLYNIYIPVCITKLIMYNNDYNIYITKATLLHININKQINNNYTADMAASSHFLPGPYV